MIYCTIRVYMNKFTFKELQCLTKVVEELKLAKKYSEKFLVLSLWHWNTTRPHIIVRNHINLHLQIHSISCARNWFTTWDIDFVYKTWRCRPAWVNKANLFVLYYLHFTTVLEEPLRVNYFALFGELGVIFYTKSPACILILWTRKMYMMRHLSDCVHFTCLWCCNPFGLHY